VKGKTQKVCKTRKFNEIRAREFAKAGGNNNFPEMGELVLLKQRK